MRTAALCGMAIATLCAACGVNNAAFSPPAIHTDSTNYTWAPRNSTGNEVVITATLRNMTGQRIYVRRACDMATETPSYSFLRPGTDTAWFHTDLYECTLGHIPQPPIEMTAGGSLRSTIHLYTPRRVGPIPWRNFTGDVRLVYEIYTRPGIPRAFSTDTLPLSYRSSAPFRVHPPKSAPD